MPSGLSITRAPVDHFAIGLEISSEKIAPPKPTTSENTSSIPTLMPFSVRKRSTPSTLSTTDSSTTTARLVSKEEHNSFHWGILLESAVRELLEGMGVLAHAAADTPNVQVTSPT